MSLDRSWQPEGCGYEELIEALRERQMVYHYEDTTVPREDVEKILEAARWAPSAHNAQMWEFVVVDDEDVRSEVARWLKKDLEWIAMIDETFPAHGRAYLDQAPVLIVVAGDIRCKAYFPDVSAYGEGEWEITNDRYYESIGCCMQNIHLAAKTLGYGTVHLTVQKKHQKELKELLGLPEYLEIHNVVPVGIPAWNEPGQNAGRYPLESMLHWNHFQTEKTKPDDEFVNELKDQTKRTQRMHGRGQ